MKLDGKIVNQSPRTKMGKCLCAKCSKLIDSPDRSTLYIGMHLLLIKHYLNQPYFIYETNKGQAVLYCSDYCRRKHNHRFKKGQ